MESVVQQEVSRGEVTVDDAFPVLFHFVSFRPVGSFRLVVYVSFRVFWFIPFRFIGRVVSFRFVMFCFVSLRMPCTGTSFVLDMRWRWL